MVLFAFLSCAAENLYYFSPRTPPPPLPWPHHEFRPFVRSENSRNPQFLLLTVLHLNRCVYVHLSNGWIAKRPAEYFERIVNRRYRARTGLTWPLRDHRCILSRWLQIPLRKVSRLYHNAKIYMYNKTIRATHLHGVTTNQTPETSCMHVHCNNINKDMSEKASG